MAGGATRAVELTNADLHLDAPGPTFAGRDVFAPVAAHLCNGMPLEEVGTAIDPAVLTPSLVPVPRDQDGGLAAEVLWVDRFGNAQLNVDADDVAEMGEPLSVTIGDDVRTMVRAGSFAELASGQYGLVVDSYGLLAIVASRHSAAAELSLSSGTPVMIRPAGR
jgi:S-adenosylmethionine hydrolase